MTTIGKIVEIAYKDNCIVVGLETTPGDLMLFTKLTPCNFALQKGDTVKLVGNTAYWSPARQTRIQVSGSKIRSVAIPRLGAVWTAKSEKR